MNARLVSAVYGDFKQKNEVYLNSFAILVLEIYNRGSFFFTCDIAVFNNICIFCQKLNKESQRLIRDLQKSTADVLSSEIADVSTTGDRENKYTFN